MCNFNFALFLLGLSIGIGLGGTAVLLGVVFSVLFCYMLQKRSSKQQNDVAALSRHHKFLIDISEADIHIMVMQH